MSSRGTNIIRSYDRVGWLVIFFHSLSLSLSLSSHLPRSTWRAWAFVAFHYVADAIFRKSMPHNTHRCQIKRFWHRSRDVRELAPLCTQTHMYKQINQTNYTSLSLSQTSVFLLPQSSLSPTQCFFIAWVNLAPEQSRWSRLGHQVSNGGASMPNASQVNLARVLAYIVEGRYSPLLYYLVFSVKFWP